MFIKKCKLIVCLILALCIAYSSIIVSTAKVDIERLKSIDTKNFKPLNQTMMNQFLLNTAKGFEAYILEDLKSHCKYIKAFNFEEVYYDWDTGILSTKCFFRVKYKKGIEVSASGHIRFKATVVFDSSTNSIGLVEVKCTSLDINDFPDWLEGRLKIQNLIGKKLPRDYWPGNAKVSNYRILNNNSFEDFINNCVIENKIIDIKDDMVLPNSDKLKVVVENIKCTNFNLKSGHAELTGDIVIIYNDSSGSIKYPIGSLYSRLDFYLYTKDNRLVFGITPNIKFNDVSDKTNNLISEAINSRIAQDGKYIKLLIK